MAGTPAPQESSGTPFHELTGCFKCVAANGPGPRWCLGMNRFDREYWDGAREMALMFYDSIKSRKDVPDDLKKLAETALRETAERKNRDFRDALGVVTPGPRIGSSR